MDYLAYKAKIRDLLSYLDKILTTSTESLRSSEIRSEERRTQKKRPCKRNYCERSRRTTSNAGLCSVLLCVFPHGFLSKRETAHSLGFNKFN